MLLAQSLDIKKEFSVESPMRFLSRSADLSKGGLPVPWNARNRLGDFLEMILYPSRSKLLASMVACLIIIVISSGALSILCGVGVLVFACQLLPGASSLRLNESGFTVRMWFRNTTYRWCDIETFGIVTWRQWGIIPVRRQVSFRYSATRRKQIKFGMRIASSIAGFDGGLPDNYGMKVKDLAAVMEQWRLRSSLLPTPESVLDKLA